LVGNVKIYILFIVFIIPSTVNSQTRTGISLMGGMGLFVAADQDYYYGIKTDAYPELAFQADMSLIRLGLHFGFIYRKFELGQFFFDPSTGSSFSYQESVLSFIPIQAEIGIAPLDALSGEHLVSPFVSLLGGVFIPAGDNDEILPAFTLRAGLEAHLEPLIGFGDIRYTFSSDDGTNAGGFFVMIGGGIRLGNRP